MKQLLLAIFLFFSCWNAHAYEVFNLNVFDQLQGKWEEGFRAKRMSAIADYILKNNPDIITFQEARGELPGAEKGGADSIDSLNLRKKYPYRKYIHEMTGADSASYGYWIGSKTKPTEWIEDGFSFSGGVERKVLGAIFGKDKNCMGLLSLHLSYQNSEVRQKEAAWILEWIKKHEKKCGHWLVVGDFNADKEDKEMQMLLNGGLHILIADLKPTIGAFNPIRKIYGEHIASRTIDWALGSNLDAKAKIILDSPWQDQWVSDHAAIWISVNKQWKGK